jgi:cellulose synthase/poly-beta-1,6-N-acetylglucosamine synthase-like glycosyltransferase
MAKVNRVYREFKLILTSVAITLVMVGLMVLFNLFLGHYYDLQNSFERTVYFIILIFTAIIFARYAILLFLSMMAIIEKTANKVSNVRYTKRRVTIIVPAYNEEMVIVQSLLSLKQQTYPNLEILVVDDGSTDRTYLKAKQLEFERGQRRLVVYRKKNGGKAKAINYGIEKATGELIVVVDADSRLNREAVELMVPYFEDPKIAAVAGSVYVVNQVNLLTKLQALEYIEGLNMVRAGQSFFKAVNIVPGPLGMFRKSALYDVGLYTDDTFAEDCDLTLRLLMKGYKVDYEFDAIAYTEAPEDLMSFIKQRYRWTRGILQAVMKHLKHLFNFRQPGLSIIIWYMLFEGILWPIADLLTNLFIIYQSATGVSITLLYWFMIFGSMDMLTALYCVLITGESMALVWWSIFYKLGFITLTNIFKIMATVEEFMGIEMGWGKLERKGRI